MSGREERINSKPLNFITRLQKQRGEFSSSVFLWTRHVDRWNDRSLSGCLCPGALVFFGSSALIGGGHGGGSVTPLRLLEQNT